MAKYKPSEPPHCPTCACGLNTETCLHLDLRLVYTETGSAYFCEHCGKPMRLITDDFALQNEPKP